MAQNYIVTDVSQGLSKENYISNITGLLQKCNDISLLDLIQKLLEKSV